MTRRPIVVTRADAHQRCVLMASELAGVLDAIIIVCSLGFLCSDFRARVLFSDWALEDERHYYGRI